MLRYLPFLLVLALWIYAFVDCLNTPEQEVRKLPKVVWAIIILLFGQVLLGPIAWFLVGRPRKNAPYGAIRPQERRWVAPDDNPDFLKSLGEHGRNAPGERTDAPEAEEQAPARDEETRPDQPREPRERREEESPQGDNRRAGGADNDPPAQGH